MRDYVNEYLAEKKAAKDGYLRDVVGRMELADGSSLSVQASGFHYCSPKEATGPWDMVEVGFPSKRWNSLSKYREDWKTTIRNNVFAFVPVRVVNAIIHRAGGFAPEI